MSAEVGLTEAEQGALDEALWGGRIHDDVPAAVARIKADAIAQERAAWVAKIERGLYEHREGALTCYDHPPAPDRPIWCCVCGAHELDVSWRIHVAHSLSSNAERVSQ